MRALILAAALLAAPVAAEPCPDFTVERQPFFGDLHVHTKYSLDAATQGTLTTPHEAYAFAKGAPLGVQPWVDGEALRSLKLVRPLDFAMVSDHAELFGEVEVCLNPELEGHDAWQCRMFRNFPRGAYYWFNYWSSQQADRVGFCGEDGGLCRAAARTPWQDVQDAAADHLETCEFTTFVGYEWTGGTAGDEPGNVHRNVLFRTAAVPELPISFIDQPTAEGLYAALDRACRDGREGCDAVVMPHNSNLSAGLMFLEPEDQAAAEQRARYERLAEVFQHKGSSECLFDPLESDDHLCQFEMLEHRSFTDRGPAQPGDGFLREVLKRGLNLAVELNVNPYQFGLIGSSDTHLGAAGAVEEGQFVGHGGAGVPASEAVPVGLPDHLDYSPGGLAVLWAEENTREALYQAIARREAYATSGPRITARFFGGEDLPDDLCTQAAPASLGYAHGVPMGGSLPAPAQAPEFAVLAARDPLGGGLDQIQIIKGWRDEQGQLHERVISVARSETSAAVNPATCEVAGDGATQLCAVWQDPDYRPSEQAFYYARVLEDRSCRWSQRLCVSAGVRCDDPSTVTEGFEGCCSAAHQPVIQERAWTSPIWVEPTR